MNSLYGVEMTLETYINGARDRLFIMVIFPFIEIFFVSK